MKFATQMKAPLARARKRRTMEQIADDIGITRAHLYRIAAGTNDPSLEVAISIVRVLKMGRIKP